MLRFERNARSRTVGLSLRKKTRRLTREILFTLFGVLFFHVAFYFIFTLKKTAPESQSYTPQKVEVAFENSFPVREVDLSIPQEAYLGSISAPPTAPSLSLLAYREPLQEKFDLGFKNTYTKTGTATVCGPFPCTLLPPLLPQLTESEEALISIRSDMKGQVFWLEWIKKTSNPTIDAAIEKWIKSLKLSSEAALSPQTIDLRLIP